VARMARITPGNPAAEMKTTGESAPHESPGIVSVVVDGGVGGPVVVRSLAGPAPGIPVVQADPVQGNVVEDPYKPMDNYPDTPEDAKTVQVLNLKTEFVLRFLPILAKRYGANTSDFKLYPEVVPDGRGNQVANTYLACKTARLAYELTGGGPVTMSYGQNPQTGVLLTMDVFFIKPTHNGATRAAFRRIDELKKRLSAIDQECKGLGARRIDLGKPHLPNDWMDEKDLGAFLHAIEKKRDAGKELAVLDVFKLKRAKWLPNVRDKKAAIDVLWDEEVQIWVELRKLQLVKSLKLQF
jgi:hypothetical protein